MCSSGDIFVYQGKMDICYLALTARKPILITKNYKFSDFLDFNERVHHCKERATLAELLGRFWIIK